MHDATRVSLLFLLLTATSAAPQSSGKTAPVEEKVTLPGSSLTLELVRLPGGKFKMGSPEGEKNRQKDEGPVREVEVKSFWIGKHEVTWEAFEAYYLYQKDDYDAELIPTMPYEPPDLGMGTGKHAAMNIQWYGANGFCKWLSKLTGDTYRLPTEAEWEYACRAGSDKPAPEPLGDYAWYKDNSDAKNREVGKKKPNAFGLHDMLGGVWEYCQELYTPNGHPAAKLPADHNCRKNDDVGDRACPHVIRGGSWTSPASELRAANRNPALSKWNERDPNIPKSKWWLTDGPFVGFRVVRETKEKK